MIKGAANGKRGRVVLLGLSTADVDGGGPILVDMRQFGVEADLLIITGPSDKHMRMNFASVIDVSVVPADASAEDVEKAIGKK